jgi:hypothetical protein
MLILNTFGCCGTVAEHEACIFRVDLIGKLHPNKAQSQTELIEGVAACSCDIQGRELVATLGCIQ